MKCEARQYSDQMVCEKCGLTWDMNDSFPPECKKETMKPHNTGKVQIGILHQKRRQLDDDELVIQEALIGKRRKRKPITDDQLVFWACIIAMLFLVYMGAGGWL